VAPEKEIRIVQEFSLQLISTQILPASAMEASQVVQIATANGATIAARATDQRFLGPTAIPRLGNRIRCQARSSDWLRVGTRTPADRDARRRRRLGRAWVAGRKPLGGTLTATVQVWKFGEWRASL
jgi:hypothetical protein